MLRSGGYRPVYRDMRKRTAMENKDIRAALDRHWAASDANNFDEEHQIYREDAVLEYPQSGERIRGRRNIQASRFAQPNKKRFTVRRILGIADLWVTEFVLTYDGQPSYSVSIMEFKWDAQAAMNQSKARSISEPQQSLVKELRSLEGPAVCPSFARARSRAQSV